MSDLVKKLVAQLEQMNRTNPKNRGKNTKINPTRITSNQTTQARNESLRLMINQKWKDIEAHLAEWKTKVRPMGKKYTNMEAYKKAVEESRKKFEERAYYFRQQAENRKKNPHNYVKWNLGGNTGKWQKHFTPNAPIHQSGTKKAHIGHAGHTSQRRSQKRSRKI